MRISCSIKNPHDLLGIRRWIFLTSSRRQKNSSSAISSYRKMMKKKNELSSVLFLLPHPRQTIEDDAKSDALDSPKMHTYRYFSSSNHSSFKSGGDDINIDIRANKMEWKMKNRCERLLLHGATTTSTCTCAPTHTYGSKAKGAKKNDTIIKINTCNALLKDLGQFKECPWSANYAAKILAKMWQLHDAGGEDIMPNKATYSFVIDLFAKSPDTTTRKKALKYHQELYDKFHITNSNSLRLNTVNYNAWMDAWSKSGEKRAGDEAEAILDKMQIMYADGHGDIHAKPDVWSFNAVLHCWAKEGNGARAEAIIDTMDRLKHKSGYEDLKPNTISYNTCIDTWSRSRSGEEGVLGNKAESILHKMLRLYNDGNIHVRPDIQSFGTVLKCWAKEGNGARAEEILQHMEGLMHQHDFRDLRPNTITYTTVIDAWAKSGVRGAGDEAEAILNKILAMYEAGDDHIRPDILSFGAVVNCWAKKGNGTRAQVIVDQMEEIVQRYDDIEDIRPNVIIYSTLIDAWSRSSQRGAGDRAEAALNKMMNLYETGDHTIQRPSTLIQIFNNVLKCWAREGNGARAEAMVGRMEEMMHQKGYEDIKPDTITYNTVIDAWAKSRKKGSGDKAEAILNKMLRRYEAGDNNTKPSIQSFGAVVNCWAKEGNGVKAQEIVDRMEDIMHQQGYEDLRPDRIVYNSLLDAWSRSGERGAGDKAEAILHRMLTLHETRHTIRTQPDIRSFNIVLKCWAKEGNGARAEAIVDHMEDFSERKGYEYLRPDTITYNALISAWARSSRKVGATKAESILAKMKRKGIAPCKITYSSVMHAYQQSKEEHFYNKATTLMKEMETLKEFDPSLGPDIITYNTFLNILAKSNNPDKVLVAEATIKKVKSDPVIRPDNRTFEAVLRCCAYLHTGDRESRYHAFTLARQIFTDIQKSTTIQPSSFTFIFYFQALANLSSGDEYEKLLHPSFGDCCKAGLLNDPILTSLRRATSPILMKKLLNTDEPPENLRVIDLPRAWSRNSTRRDKVFRKSG